MASRPHPRTTSRRGDSTSNVLIFITMIIVGLVVVTWYIQSVRPTRQIIGSVVDDIDGIGRHIANACGSGVYRGTFQPSTTSARFISNGTHYCVITDIFGSCEPALCAIEPVALQFGFGGLLNITRRPDDIVRFTGTNVLPATISS